MSAEKKIKSLGLILPKPLQLPLGVKLPFSWVLIRGKRVTISGHVPLNDDGTIYDIKGNKIDNIWSSILNHGTHSFNWDASNQSTGIYIIKCNVQNMTTTQKIFLIK